MCKEPAITAVALAALLVAGGQAAVLLAAVDEALHSVAQVVRRGELTDAQWAKLEPSLPPQKPKTGKPNKDQTGAPWRDLPERYSPWSEAGVSR